MKKLQFIDIGKPFRIIGKICKDIERAFRFKGINVNFIVMMIDYIGFAFILKWNLHPDENKVKRIIQNITYELEERLIFSNKQYDLTVSCGYVPVAPNAKNIKELIAKADKLMYLDKQNKNQGAVNGDY